MHENVSTDGGHPLTESNPDDAFHGHAEKTHALQTSPESLDASVLPHRPGCDKGTEAGQRLLKGSAKGEQVRELQGCLLCKLLRVTGEAHICANSATYWKYTVSS